MKKKNYLQVGSKKKKNNKKNLVPHKVALEGLKKNLKQEESSADSIKFIIIWAWCYLYRRLL